MRSTLAMPLILFALSMTAIPAGAAEKTLSEADLTKLLAHGKTLALGGKGMGYTGTVTLTADGRGDGSAKTDDGTVIPISGTWRIKGDRFCRKWKDLDGGKEVCETWRLASPNHVNVYNGKKKIGANSW